MIIDGRTIAREIFRETTNMVTHCPVRPHLTVFTCAPNFETRAFLALKKRKADTVGVGVSVVEFPETITTDEVVESLSHAALQTDGIIVQLPFPHSIDIDTVANAVPSELDADAFGYTGAENDILPPVVGAIAEIACRHGVSFVGANVVVVGHGRLVGRPAARFAESAGASVSVVTEHTEHRADLIKNADILILGVGNPHLITPDMVKDGVVIFDAGTSESSGVLVGDAHPDCAEKAALMTPVPNGIGPITIAALLRNVVLLAARHTNRPRV